MSLDWQDKDRLLHFWARRIIAANEEVNTARDALLKAASNGTVVDIEEAVENYVERYGWFNGLHSCHTLAGAAEDGQSAILSMLAELKRATERTPSSRAEARQIRAFSNAINEGIVAITDGQDGDEPRVKRFTTAPPSYDGFGTRTIEVFEAKEIGGRAPLRHVSIVTKHLEWQESRYGSGLHCCLIAEECGKELDLKSATGRA